MQTRLSFQILNRKLNSPPLQEISCSSASRNYSHQIRADEERLINYAKGHEILSLDAAQNTVVDRLSGLNKALLEAENDRKIAEAAFRVNKEPGAAEVEVTVVLRNWKDSLLC